MNIPGNILIPAFSLAGSAELLDIAESLLACYGGVGTVLSVVEVPEERSLSEGALVVRRRRSLLRKIAHLRGGEGLRAEVRTAHSLDRGIQDAVEAVQAGLLLLPWKPRSRSAVSGLEWLVGDPPCDLVVLKAGAPGTVKSVMVPARGGPHARLALRVAEAVAAQGDAVLTLVHVTNTGWDRERRASEEEYFQEIRREVTYPKVRDVEIVAESVEHALLEEGTRHDLVVMGAAARDEPSSYLFGRLPETLARRLIQPVVVVKTREPVTAGTFGLPARSLIAPEHRDLSEMVDGWFAENTFHSHEFRNLRYLLDLK